MNPEPEPADLSLSPLYIQPCNYSVRDGQGNSYFVTETSVGKDDRQPMFESISRKPRSRFMLLGIGVATIKIKNLLVYEDGSPWESTSIEDLRYRTREFLCSLHHLHYNLKVCHQRISHKAKNSLVVSRSSTGKLAGTTGCKDCSKNAEKERLCHYQARYKDLCDVVDYINLYMHAYLDLEFKTFLKDKGQLMRLISHPPEVIYQQPLWIAHPINKLFSRSVLNRHFKRFMNNFGNNSRVRAKVHAYYQKNNSHFSKWRSFVQQRPNLNHIYAYSAVSYIKTNNVNLEVLTVARFARNVYEHSATSDYLMSEHHLEQMMPSFRSFLFSLMVEFDNFADWNLEKIV